MTAQKNKQLPGHLAAFTLLELLVVVAVIAMVAMLLAARSSTVSSQAKRAQCLAQLRQWNIAFTMYCNDNQGSMPLGWYGLDANPPYPASAGEFALALQPYVKTNNNIFFCPMAITPRTSLPPGQIYTATSPNLAWGTVGINGYTTSWDPSNVPVAGSYGINAWMYNPPASVPVSDISPQDVPAFWRKLTPALIGYGGATVPAQNIPVISDCVYDGGTPYNSDPPPSAPNSLGSPGADNIANFLMLRHEGTKPVDMAFLDSSVRTVGLREQWTLNWSKNYNPAQGPGSHGFPLWMRSYQ